MWRIIDVLTWCEKKFKSIGIETSRLDSEILVAHALNFNRLQLYLNYDRPLTKLELANIKNLIKKRIKRIPVAYIIGKKEFMGLDFNVIQGVFIPRPETEILVEYLIDEIKKRNLRHGIDVCAGTGCIGISLMYYCKNLKMKFLEVEPDSFKCLVTNIEKFSLNQNAICIKHDILDFNFNSKVDFVVSNPPYIPENEILELEPEVSKYHKKISLNGGKDGLKYYPVIISKFKKNLNPQGLIAFEVGYNQAEKVKSLLQQHGFITKVIKDYQGILRHVIGYKTLLS